MLSDCPECHVRLRPHENTKFAFSRKCPGCGKVYTQRKRQSETAMLGEWIEIEVAKQKPYVIRNLHESLGGNFYYEVRHSQSGSLLESGIVNIVVESGAIYSCRGIVTYNCLDRKMCGSFDKIDGHLAFAKFFHLSIKTPPVYNWENKDA